MRYFTFFCFVHQIRHILYELLLNTMASYPEPVTIPFIITPLVFQIVSFYIITRVHSNFSLVENRDLLEDRRTADAISKLSTDNGVLCFV